MTLLSVELSPPAPEAPSVHDSKPRTRVLVYVPLAVAIILILLPHPSYVIMITSFYLRTRRSPVAFWVHLLAVYSLTFVVFSSLMACVVRDPGRVTPGSSRKSSWAGREGEAEDTAAFLGEEDETGDVDEMKAAGRWCRRCELRRPERAHHCSTCGHCVLKMDHHCPWLGGNCVGYRTYPSFLHFLFSTTLLAAYMGSVALSVMVNFISDPFLIDPRVTPLHSLFLVLMGAIFALTMGSFLLYHVYLASTNQTTLEHMSPFLLLRYIPALQDSTNDTFPPSHAPSDPVHVPFFRPPPPRYPPPPSSPRARPKVATALAEPPTPPFHSPVTSPLSPSPTVNPHTLRANPLYVPGPFSFPMPPPRPPEEHELSSAQRRLVQHTHGRLRPYDVGIRANWAQVFGGGRRGLLWWVHLVLWGGSPRGDGYAFPRKPGMEAALERLARGLDDIKRQEERSRAGGS